MRLSRLIVLAATTVVPAIAWAGGGPAPMPPPVAAAPVLGDAGLIALGIGLVGAGVAFLRKR
jgi:hypothetical protein